MLERTPTMLGEDPHQRAPTMLEKDPHQRAPHYAGPHQAQLRPMKNTAGEVLNESTDQATTQSGSLMAAFQKMGTERIKALKKIPGVL